MLGLYHKDVWNIAERLEDVMFQHTPRGTNRVAHTLAHVAARSAHRFIWILDAPSVIFELLLDDCKHK